MRRTWRVVVTSLATIGFLASLYLGFFPSEFYPLGFLGMGWSRTAAFLVSFLIAAGNTCLFCFSSYWLIYRVGDRKIRAMVEKLLESNNHQAHRRPAYSLAAVKLRESGGLGRIKAIQFSRWNLTTLGRRLRRIAAKIIRFFSLVIDYLRTRGVWLFGLALILTGLVPAMMKVGLALIVLSRRLGKIPFLLVGIAVKLWFITFFGGETIRVFLKLWNSLFH